VADPSHEQRERTEGDDGEHDGDEYGIGTIDATTVPGARCIHVGVLLVLIGISHLLHLLGNPAW
jgi:hypothetical protein